VLWLLIAAHCLSIMATHVTRGGRFTTLLLLPLFILGAAGAWRLCVRHDRRRRSQVGT
jgi:hypothetical protein